MSDTTVGYRYIGEPEAILAPAAMKVTKMSSSNAVELLREIAQEVSQVRQDESFIEQASQADTPLSYIFSFVDALATKKLELVEGNKELNLEEPVKDVLKAVLQLVNDIVKFVDDNLPDPRNVLAHIIVPVITNVDQTVSGLMNKLRARINHSFRPNLGQLEIDRSIRDIIKINFD